MDALGWLRAVLVGFALVASVLLAVEGHWAPAGVMVFGVLAHFWLFAHLHSQRVREAEQAELLER